LYKSILLCGVFKESFEAYVFLVRNLLEATFIVCANVGGRTDDSQHDQSNRQGRNRAAYNPSQSIARSFRLPLLR
jgi:hypothetical protein